jgi:integrase
MGTLNSGYGRNPMSQRAKPERKYLTKTVVEAALPYPDKDHLIWDTDRGKSKGVRGFALKVRPSGHKTFILQYRFGVRVRRYHIGVYPDWAVGRAREEADRLRSKIKDKIDPMEEKVQQRRAEELARLRSGREGGAPEDGTLGDLCDQYLEKWSKRTKRSWREDERRINKFIKPRLGRRKPEEVTKQQVESFFLDISKGEPDKKGRRKARPTEANRVLVLLASIYAWGIDTGYLSGIAENPAKRKSKERNPETERQRVLSSDERPKLLTAIQAEPDPYARALFKLLLLTGLRRSEWLNAKWVDVDLAEKRLVLPKTKAGKPRTIPLSDQAVAIIRSLPDEGRFKTYILPAHNFDGRNFSFEGKKDHPMSIPKRQWRRVRKAAGCDDATNHDLRRTASTIVLKKTRDPKTAQKVLGHADLQTTLKHYATVTEEDQIQAVGALDEEWQKAAQEGSKSSES